MNHPNLANCFYRSSIFLRWLMRKMRPCNKDKVWESSHCLVLWSGASGSLMMVLSIFRANSLPLCDAGSLRNLGILTFILWGCCKDILHIKLWEVEKLNNLSLKFLRLLEHLVVSSHSLFILYFLCLPSFYSFILPFIPLSCPHFPQAFYLLICAK